MYFKYCSFLQHDKKIKKTNVADKEEQKFNYPLIVIEGEVVGIFQD
jgi:disulfide oxidoreductase YuzD